MFTGSQIQFKRNFFVGGSVPDKPTQLFAADLSDGNAFPGEPLRGPGDAGLAHRGHRRKAGEKKNVLREERTKIHHRTLLHAEPPRRVIGFDHVSVAADYDTERIRIWT